MAQAKWTRTGQVGNGTRFRLGEDRVADKRYNLVADLPVPVPPPLHPGRLDPWGPDHLAPLFLMTVVQQDVSAERYVPIPDDIRDI